jgi:NAD(P)-dependent dehydrogenase (short-subunit alcohol dehydrogenase family)
MGLSIAQELARRGATVVVNDRVHERTHVAVESIRAAGGDALGVTASISRAEGAGLLMSTVERELGGLDILVNNVGGIKGPMENPIWAMSEEQWDSTIAVNLKGTYLCTHLALPGMIDRRHGKIVNLSSVSWSGHPFNAAYAAAKAAIVAFTRSVATSVGQYDINVNAVAPGMTRTGVIDRMDEVTSGGRGAGAMVPLGRINEPEDVSATVAFLVSDAARNISGQLITIAGGVNGAL